MYTTFRSEFRELFEVHFSRFDSKLEQRVGEVKAELRQEMAHLETRLLRWAFAFWITALGAITALIRLTG